MAGSHGNRWPWLSWKGIFIIVVGAVLLYGIIAMPEVSGPVIGSAGRAIGSGLSAFWTWLGSIRNG